MISPSTSLSESGEERGEGGHRQLICSKNHTFLALDNCTPATRVPSLSSCSLRASDLSFNISIRIWRGMGGGEGIDNLSVARTIPL